MLRDEVIFLKCYLERYIEDIENNIYGFLFCEKTGLVLTELQFPYNNYFYS